MLLLKQGAECDCDMCLSTMIVDVAMPLDGCPLRATVALLGKLDRILHSVASKGDTNPCVARIA